MLPGLRGNHAALGLGPRSSATAQVVPTAIRGTAPRKGLIKVARGGSAVAGDDSPKACGGTRRVRQARERGQRQSPPHAISQRPRVDTADNAASSGWRDCHRPPESQDTALALCEQQGHGFCLIPVCHVHVDSPLLKLRGTCTAPRLVHTPSVQPTPRAPSHQPPSWAADPATTLAGPSPAPC